MFASDPKKIPTRDRFLELVLAAHGLSLEDRQLVPYESGVRYANVFSLGGRACTVPTISACRRADACSMIADERAPSPIKPGGIREDERLVISYTFTSCQRTPRNWERKTTLTDVASLRPSAPCRLRDDVAWYQLGDRARRLNADSRTLQLHRSDRLRRKKRFYRSCKRLRVPDGEGVDDAITAVPLSIPRLPVEVRSYYANSSRPPHRCGDLPWPASRLTERS